ncbi:MAG: hypothetical protein OXF26_03345, partial [Alphaproteobacteria bacterium]|nr:hypothetical protein [Alphaproteobacteria bacterium]
MTQKKSQRFRSGTPRRILVPVQEKSCRHNKKIHRATYPLGDRVFVPCRPITSEDVKSTVDDYTALYDVSLDSRKEHYSSLVNQYYDLATDFYEFGWVQSFHFAPRRRGEAFTASLLRHQ